MSCHVLFLSGVEAGLLSVPFMLSILRYERGGFFSGKQEKEKPLGIRLQETSYQGNNR
ncbi:hypothetical protein JOC95_002564 [Bacillus tianshenii]|uniref:Uncharacterized protein n=1 Tax=Sutcliffiella tianshenii TaxID=1463404 RepID=A0ABS2P1F6_9BACI|nr:hypothetical protein [Bacillus tianshenii]